MTPRPPTSTLFPYTTLFRSSLVTAVGFPTRYTDVVREAREYLGTNPRYSRASRTTSVRSEEHTSELQSLRHLVCRLLLEKKKKVHKGSYTMKTHITTYKHMS